MEGPIGGANCTQWDFGCAAGSLAIFTKIASNVCRTRSVVGAERRTNVRKEQQVGRCSKHASIGIHLLWDQESSVGWNVSWGTWRHILITTLIRKGHWNTTTLGCDAFDTLSERNK